MIWGAVYLISYIGFLGPVLLIGLCKNRRKETRKVDKPLQLDQVSVVIPFRNEEDRIMPLLQSLKNQTVLPHELLFVDDHSTDKGLDMIRAEMKGFPYKIVKLDQVEGKKAAIEVAIEQVKTEYVLTLDADVTLAANYFEQLSTCEQVDMIVLPVAMRAKSFLQRFFEMDLLLATGVNTGLAGLSRPIMASGANLLYRRDRFIALGGFASNRQYASGDDTFLLRSFTRAGQQVILLSDPRLAVRTDTPSTFSEYLMQRLRWLGKTTALKDPLNTFTALIQGVLGLLFVVIFGMYLVKANYDYALTIFLLKTLADMLLFFFWFKRSKRLSSWLLIPVYELYFPVLSLLMLTLIPFYRIEWKGRTS